MKSIFQSRMNIGFLVFLFAFSFSAGIHGKTVSLGLAAYSWAQDGAEADDIFDDEFDSEPEITISDPLEPVNRAFFHFNDKLYFWALKPVARAYGAVIPQSFRICVRNAFHNVLFPVRFVNNVLQGKFKNAGIELSRFCINTTAGVAGFGDPAKEVFGLQIKDEDLGQTFGYWGIGNGIYFCWPLFGPSTARDTLGLFGDSYLSPLAMVYNDDPETGLALYGLQQVNNTSLVIGDYEAFKESSFDPYISLRDAYIQYRRSKIRDSNRNDSIY